MVRSLWLRTLATSLVWTGVVCAQQSTSTAKDTQAEQILTIQEAGKAPQKCKVMKSWRTTDGQVAYQVRVIDTGEMMTITEKAGAFGSRPQNTAMQIYHWGSMRSSPPGVPAPAANSPTISSYGVKSTPVTTPNLPSPYVGSAAQARVPVTGSPYVTNVNAASRPITTPSPEKDWRQSWAQADDKPLRVAEKPSTRDSIADAPQLKIEGKAPVKDIALKGGPAQVPSSVASRPTEDPATRKVSAAVAKQTAPVARPVVKFDEPLLLPDTNASLVLDITPRAKAPESVTVDSTATKQVATETPKKAKPSATEVSESHVPTIADLAAGTPTSKPATVTIRPNSAPTVSTSADGKTLTVRPAKTVSKPETQVVIDESKAQLEAKPSNKLAGLPVIPEMPEPIKPAMPAPVAKEVDKKIGTATASSEPVIPELPMALPSIPTGAAPPTMPTVAALPSIPPPATDMARPLNPLPHTEPARSERPSFLVMDAGRSAASEHSIRLPGEPSAVIAFGQPVTVTAPPPDLVRNKSLESHSIQVLMEKLKDSLYPSQREWAAEGLTSANWKVHPEVVEALCKAATDDPAPTVRARCAHSLAHMEIRTAKSLDAIHKLQADKDESVRTQADEALKILQPIAETHE